jgi:hypothetical protein
MVRRGGGGEWDALVGLAAPGRGRTAGSGRDVLSGGEWSECIAPNSVKN